MFPFGIAKFNYPGALRNAEAELDPSLLTDYAFALASQFAKFYEKNPVLSADPETKNFRLHLVASVKQVLANLLNILGVIPLEKIWHLACHPERLPAGPLRREASRQGTNVESPPALEGLWPGRKDLIDLHQPWR